jgi:type IV pilus assembly protein PilQ
MMWLLLPVALAVGVGPAIAVEPAPAVVAGVEMLATARGTEVVIHLTGDFAYGEQFATPSRISVVLPGVALGVPAGEYTVLRGGVKTIGIRADVTGSMRIDLLLDDPSTYALDRRSGGLVVRIAGRTGPFEPWQLGDNDSPSPTSVAAALADVGGNVAEVPPPAVQDPERVNVDFLDADVRDVLATFAEFSGRSIIPGAGVGGQVTATIRDQPWDIALYTILRAYGLAAQELPSGIIQVDAIERLREREAIEPLITTTFRINYVPVAEMAAALEPLRSERGGISANPTTNTLVVTEVAPVLETMRGILEQLDVRTPQVAIQAKIVFVNRTDVEELGVTYDLRDSRGPVGWPSPGAGDDLESGAGVVGEAVRLAGPAISALGNAKIRVSQPQLEALLSLVFGRYSLTAFIDALHARELSDVQAAPTITTLDNQPAEIWVGERTPIRVVDAGTTSVPGAGGSAPRATAELVETGIRLRVTPTITADRRILMQLHAERSSAQLAATDIGVVFQQQQGTTRLMVRDGETAVIGGLTVTETSASIAGIPVLMDLPVIGALFRTTREREQKRDLLIMVTPRIVDDPS